MLIQIYDELLLHINLLVDTYKDLMKLPYIKGIAPKLTISNHPNSSSLGTASGKVRPRLIAHRAIPI